jgi:subtilisin family serine protease
MSSSVSSTPDFLDNGKTRFLAIWDQGGDFRNPPAQFGYGSELTKAHLDAAVAASRRPGGLPATELERQSQRGEGSHGTHVASIAAGSRGVCPKAAIAAVLIDVPRQGSDLEERRTTFSDSTRIVHAVEYLLEIARREGKPISINISLGTNGGAHDGSSGVSRWLDAALAAEGRSLCVAAGNAGQEAPTEPDDIGWMMGRVHSGGQITSRGLAIDLQWTVVGNMITDVSENELEIWYNAQDRLTVQVKPPGANKWIGVGPRQFIENRRLPSGTFLSIYNELYHPTNGCNYVAIYLSPDLDPASPKGVQAGVWTVRLQGEDIRDGHFHCWIERDDPYEFDRVGQRRVFRFPSFFSTQSNIDSHSINSLACGHRVIAVANLDVERQRINVTSSQGPTRDGRQKPDIAGPGTDIVAANGFGAEGDLWTSMSGTSMASPYVAGVVGLMLAVNPKLTAAQCNGILQRTSIPLPGASYSWKNDTGFGQIDPEAAIDEAINCNVRVDLG